VAELPSIDSPNNPNFLGMKKTLGLEFKPHTSFAKKDIDERQALIQTEAATALAVASKSSVNCLQTHSIPRGYLTETGLPVLRRSRSD
jgi:hypothetical protein